VTGGPWRLGTALKYSALAAVGVAVFLFIDARGRSLSAPEAATVFAPSVADAPARPEPLVQVLIALTAVLVTGQLLGQAFRYVGQPPVIGEVVGGLLLGPSFLGWAAPQVKQLLLPESVAPHLGVIAQLGVILYMFLVGLELDRAALRQRARTALAVSHTSIVLPFLLGAGVALVLYPRLSRREVPFTSFALFLGVAMSITAFPVLARILTDRQMHQTPLGVMALTCDAIGDVTAWCLLAFAVGVAQARMGGAVLTLLLAAAYIGLVLLVVRPLSSRLLARLDEARVGRGAVALVSGAVLLSAICTVRIGVHAIFGAFLLGAVISHDSAIARALTAKLEDVVTVLFLPAYFAFTGLRTEVGLVSGWGEWLLLGLILLVAAAGKFGGTLAAARLTGEGWRESAALGVLMNTRGLMELVVLNIGLDLGVISRTLFAMLVLIAVATTLATAPLLHLLVKGEALEPAAAKAAPADCTTAV
jgi:Kef-type K+ transport system membrane component KefB